MRRRLIPGSFNRHLQTSISFFIPFEIKAKIVFAEAFSKQLAKLVPTVNIDFCGATEFLTAQSFAVAALRGGARGFIVKKPVKLKELRITLQNAL